MKLKELKCPNCSAKLEIQSLEATGICPYCDSEFILEDETIKIKHEHEIIDDSSLDIAETTLNKFKDYEKAEYIYRNLIYKYAHKEEVYIGLIRSITHDFKQPVESIFQLNEINDYWQKYTSLTTKTNIAKYAPTINELNKNFYLKRLNKETQDLSLYSLKVNINDAEVAWNKYVLFSEEKEHSKLETKYKNYITKLKELQSKKKRQLKFGLIALVSLIIILVLGTIIYSYIETPTPKYKTLKTSTIYKDCDPNFECKNKDFIKKYFYPTIADLTIEKVNFNKEKNTLTVQTKLASEKRNIEKEITFKVKDDSGPYIKQTNCEFTDIEKVNLDKCFTLEDYTDGIYTNNRAKVTNNNKFNKQGTYKIKVSATDKDKNKEEKEIEVKIIPTPITLNVNLSKTSIEINSTGTISYEITPDVKNKDITYTYDNEIISLENGTIKPLKLGETELCVISKYDTNTKVCNNIEITPICQNSYTFNFDGSKNEKIYAGIDFCEGTYKVYGQVLNYNQIYTIRLDHEDFSIPSSSITIAKFSDFLSDEGDQWTINKGSYIETAPGVTQITITK